jgi:RNA polymerase sigma factor (sigma-70 family)
VPDHDLARRYADTRDEAAFELLVRRHADAVWAACRRVLRDHQAAEDAFQATFLALARRAGSIRTPCVAGWLYRVAVRAALRLRSDPVREPTDRAAPADNPDRGEASAVVHEEVARLAEKYRLPVVLCDLSGLTHAEAAARLGWPVGTVSGRLSLARDRLRSQLTRRGVSAPAALVALTGVGPASADQLRTVVSHAAGGVVPPAVSTLADGVLSAMFWSKAKLTAALAATLVFAGASSLAVVGQDRTGPRLPADPPPAPARPAAAAQPPAAAKPAEPPRADRLKELQKERLGILKDRLELTRRLVDRGVVPLAEVRSWQEKVALAEAELVGRTGELRAAAARQVTVAQEREKRVEAQVQSGTASMADLFEARLARLDAEIALARLPE